MISLPTPIFIDYRSGEYVDLIKYIKEKEIKMVYWDLGGTLVDILVEIKQKNIEAINATCKCTIDLAIYDALLQKEWKQRETSEAQQKIKFVKTDEDELEYWKDFFGNAFKKYNLRKSPTLLEKLAKIYANARSFEKYPYVDEILAELENLGIRTGIISNAFRSARRILKQKGLITKFNSEYLFLSCEYNSIKPEENIYKKAIEKAGVDAREIVFIDDRESFLGQAVKLGMNALVIRHEERTDIPSSENRENATRYPASISSLVISKIRETVWSLFLPVTRRFNLFPGGD